MVRSFERAYDLESGQSIVKLGNNVKLSKFINLYGCEIGAFVEIQKNARVGSNCKISSHTRCPRTGVVDERHAVTDKDLVFNGYALADERACSAFMLGSVAE